MKAWEVGAFGLENLRLVDRAVPDPGPGEARVRLRAVSLNYRDLLMVQGMYNPKQKLPLVPCSDGAGVVDAVGPGVARVKVGDRVAGQFCLNWIAGPPRLDRLRATLGGPLDGTLTEQIVLPAESLVHLPAHLSDEEASTLPCAALTAWTALVVYGGVKAGDIVLVQGTGGVSVFALQIARLLGARVIVTSSSDEKLARARALGASDGVNYAATPAWGRAVRELTGGEGVDLIVEIGGAGTIDQSLSCIRVGGQISLIGIVAGAQKDLLLTRILMQSVRVQGILVGNRDGFEEMNRAFALHGVRPIVDRVFPFEEAPAAMEYLRSGQHFGKVVVRASAE